MFHWIVLCAVGLWSTSSHAAILDMTRIFDNSSRRWPSPHSAFHLRSVYAAMQPGGFWMQFEDVESGIHVGTHMDAPRHFCKDCWTIAEIPIDRLVARPAAVIDIRVKTASSPDTGVDVEDVLAYEEIYGEIPKGAVIFQCSGWADKYDDTMAYLGNDRMDVKDFHYPGFGVDATKWLIRNRDIYGLAVDTLSTDRGDALLFPTHVEYSKHNLFSLENVANTCQIPPSGALVHVLPTKIRDASGGHARVVATWDTETTFCDSSGATRPHIITASALVIMLTCILI